MQIESIEQKNRERTGPEAVIPPSQADFPTELPLKEKLSSPTHPSGDDSSSRQQDLQKTEVDKVSNALEKFWDAMGVSLQFKVDKETDIIQVEVIDPGSSKIIKKIPADEILHMAASLRESVGFLVDKEF